MTEPPFQEDFFQRIVNVNWGGAAIVVFMDSSIWAEVNVGEHIILNSKVEFLTQFTALSQEQSFHPGYTCFAYKVPHNVGEFMTTISPPQSADLEKYIGYWFTVAVFAMDSSNTAGSLQRAIDGVKLIAPAFYMVDHSEGDLPWNMAPPGLLWLVQTEAMHSGRSENWKMRYGKHRADDQSEPPNAMVQCYPLGPPFVGPFADGEDKLNTGYDLFAYRLDRAGTGTVYAKRKSANEGGGQNVDPAWAVPVIVGTPYLGIPYQDPPPLISADLV